MGRLPTTYASDAAIASPWPMLMTMGLKADIMSLLDRPWYPRTLVAQSYPIGEEMLSCSPVTILTVKPGLPIQIGAILSLVKPLFVVWKSLECGSIKWSGRTVEYDTRGFAQMRNHSVRSRGMHWSYRPCAGPKKQIGQRQPILSRVD